MPPSAYRTCEQTCSAYIAAMQHFDELDGKIAICAVALDRKVVMLAKYNGAAVELHPHQLVERNGAVYVRAFNPAKSRLANEHGSLGLYHLKGLTDLALCGRTFEPLAGDVGHPARAGDRVIQAL